MLETRLFSDQKPWANDGFPFVLDHVRREDHLSRCDKEIAYCRAKSSSLRNPSRPCYIPCAQGAATL